MQTKTVEIRPGYSIVVTSRLRKKSGVRVSALSRLRALSEGERREVLGRMTPTPNVKYSRALLDEAVEAAAQLGLKKAAKLTGVKYWSIVQRQREIRHAAGVRHPNGCKGKYTLQQKQQCVRLARSLIATGNFSQGPAFAEAGKRLGVNGGSIQWMWSQKHFQ